MTLEVLTVVVVALYAISSTLVALLVVHRRLSLRRARLHAAAVERLRGRVEECLLDGRPLPRLRRHDEPALIELAVRYATFVKGRELEVLVSSLEKAGLVDTALQQLHASHEWDRADAAELLGRLRVQRAVPQLVAALQDPSEVVRTTAARSLAAIGAPEAIPALVTALKDSSRWTVSLLADNLILMGPRAVTPLLGMLDSGDHKVRVAAVQILGEIRDAAAIRPLANIAVRDENLNLRAQATAALGKLGGPDAQQALLAALRDREWQVRAQAAKALGRHGDPVVAQALADAMPDESWWVRVNCAEALAKLGDAGVSRLEAQLDHPDRYVREQVAGVLEAFGLRGQRREATPAAAGANAGGAPA